jgi:hypothetical protein
MMGRGNPPVVALRQQGGLIVVRDFPLIPNPSPWMGEGLGMRVEQAPTGH